MTNETINEQERTRAEISRANSVAHSTGPRTEQGKNISRYNGIKHGLAGQRLIMADDELEDFTRMNRAFLDDLQPSGATEISLVESIVFANWQLARARAYETNMLTDGARLYTDASDPARDFETDHTRGITRTFDEKLKQLDTVSRYTTRFHRQILQAEGRLRYIQAIRKRESERREQEAKRIHESRRKESQRRHNEARARYQQRSAEQNASEARTQRDEVERSKCLDGKVSRFAPQTTDSTHPIEAVKSKNIHEIAIESRKNVSQKKQIPAA